MFDLSDLLIKAIGSGALLGFGREVYRVYKQHNAYTFKRVAGREARIYDVLNYMLHNTGADKVFIVKLHNGGDVIQNGTPIYSSVTHEVSGKDLNPIRKKWRNQLVDNFHMNMILKMMNDPQKNAVVYTEKKINNEISLKAAGSLSDLYKSQGVSHALASHVHTYEPKFRPFEIKFLGIKKKNSGETYYLNLVYKDDRAPDSNDFFEIQSGTNEIKNILLEQYKYD